MPHPPNVQNYGVPLFGAAWVPYKELISKLNPPDQPPSSTAEDSTPAADPVTVNEYYVVLAGGGREGHHGIPNVVLLSRFDFASRSLSPQPVAKLGFDSDLPYRMVVHPGGDGLICAMQNSCRHFEWDEAKDDEGHTPQVKVSEKVLTKLEDVGQQLALAFNSDGSVLAAVGEDGSLRVFKWPSMGIILNVARGHSSSEVKDLCFSLDGKYLVSLGKGGPGRVWDDELFATCRFSQSSDGAEVLYIASNTGKGASILTWNRSSWKRKSSKHIVRDPVSSFNVSPDRKFLAIGTAQGDVLLVNSTSMQVQTLVKKAHFGMVAALGFSHDSRAVVSACMGNIARVTLVEDKKSGGSSLWIIIFIILHAIAAYLLSYFIN